MLTIRSTDEESIEGIRQQMKTSNGIGNLKNMFIYAPGGKDKGLRKLPRQADKSKGELWPSWYRYS